jgi:hypothetical protein
MVDCVFRTRSLGTAAEGVRDQYADGKAARVWEVFIGDKNSRTQHYQQFLVGLLRAKGCRTVLDVACGTGWATDSDSWHLIIFSNDGWCNHRVFMKWHCIAKPGNYANIYIFSSSTFLMSILLFNAYSALSLYIEYIVGSTEIAVGNLNCNTPFVTCCN